MLKKPIVLIPLILLIVSIIGLSIKSRTQPSTPQTSFSPAPSAQIPKSQLILPTGETMTVEGKEVNNVYNGSVEVNNNGDALFVETKAYQETYIRGGQYFLISILKTPFEKNRKAAEEEFLKKLGISQDEACELDVRISTPYFINPNESGKTYRLSFCE